MKMKHSPAASYSPLAWFFLFTLLLFSFSCQKNTDGEVTPENPTTNLSALIRAVDASLIPEIREQGVLVRNSAGQEEDMLTALQKNGVNTIRLRLWHTPASSYASLAAVKTLAAEARTKDIKVWLTVHYSDTWADPGQQTKPAAWKNLNYATLRDSLYAYTRLITREIQPDIIQIGNEINRGLLWPEGHANQPAQMQGLLKAGIQAVREQFPATKIMLHFAGHDGAQSFFTGLQELDVDYYGLSYYPIWHGKNLTGLQANVSRLFQQFKKPVLLAEIAYPFTFGYNDWTNNIIGDNTQILDAYPATPEGQQAYLRFIHQWAKTSEALSGYAYWGGEWVAYRGNQATDGSPWENQALWDFNLQALPALRVFGE